ncbi:hypothetical protein A5625_10160 [Mycobacterium sp. 1465703.0]|nr:hypothetical protein A5625_10160 [Mycobacterium sp. 1465703.0]
MARQIRVEIAGYARVAVTEHNADVHRQISDIVAGLQSRTTPNAAQIQFARQIGRQRSIEGLALTEVIEAYHIAFRETWDELLRWSRDRHRGLDALSQVGLLWSWIHRLSAAVADAHAEKSMVSEGARTMWRQELIDALIDRRLGRESEVVAERLGYRLEKDEFTVICCAADSNDGINELNARLAASVGVGHCGNHADQSFTISQGVPTDTLLQIIRDSRPASPFGIGVARQGLGGAAMSLRDAADAFKHAQSAGAEINFETDWLAATVAAHARRFDAILSVGTSVARRNPRLADAVRAYASSGFSISACARELGIHPNSVKYRLQRWSALTGWRFDTFLGLVNSVASLSQAAHDAPAVVPAGNDAATLPERAQSQKDA